LKGIEEDLRQAQKKVEKELNIKAGYIGAALLLTLYYLSHPPLLNAAYLLRPEGSYLWVDKNLIMLAATIVLLYFPTSGIIGLDSIMNKKIKKR